MDGTLYCLHCPYAAGAMCRSLSQISSVCMPFLPAGKCLSQLSFSDATSMQDCYLYRLAHQTNLADFKFVVLVTSPQV